MKKTMTAVAALAMSVGFSMFLFPGTAQATEVWNNIDNGWEYLDQDDKPVTEAWRKSKDSWYYLSKDGLMLKKTIFRDREANYYVDEDGRMAQNTWVFVDAENGAGGEFEEGWYYFGADGKGYRRKNNSFKRNIGGATYIFDENGKMLSGWIDENGDVVANSDDPFVDGLYYAREDGKLLAGEWLDYGGIGDGIGGSSLDSDVAGRNYTDYDKMWLYFDTNAKKVKSSGDSLKQKTINGARYGFDENGIMLPWWSKVGSISDADKKTPVSDISAKYFAGYDGGGLIRNAWFWMYPSENLDADDYNSQKFSWWYTDGNGQVYRNKIRKINGRYYAFDGIGRMQAGFVLFDGKSEFVAQYDLDNWSSSDFIEGNIYGTERSDLYLFSPDEFNDGSMKTGKDIAVEIKDGVYHFGFAPDGKAYGNRNRLQRKDNMYYINGLRLEGNEDYGYGVVKDSETNSYYVVNANGSVVKGRRRIVKDKDDGYLIILDDQFAARVTDESRPVWRNGDEGLGYYHYDKNNKDNHYAGGLVAAHGDRADLDGLAAGQRLNFD